VFTDAVKQETAGIVLAFLLAECAEIYKQTRANQKNITTKKNR
jgi:hypothetical protein